MNIRWDADAYTRDFDFVHQYSGDVMSLLDLRAGETVLDLGCGNGALTRRLADAGVNAVGMDASPELLAAARETYPELTFLAGDATDFTLERPVDAVFSNAVFHWIGEEDQPAMLRCVNGALREGGQLVFEFGGRGNNRKIHRALAEAFAAAGLVYRMPFYFPSIGTYAPLLEAAGFEVSYAALFERPTKLKGKDGLTDWIRMFVRTPFDQMPEETERQIIETAVSRLRPELWRDGVWYADYVRLRCRAVKRRPPVTL